MTKERTLDLSEKGLKDGQPVSLDRRLFMKFTAFTGCADADEASAALAAAGVEGALYLDANDPKGVGLIVLSEDPDYFVSRLRDVFNAPPFAALTHKPEFDMLGRTSAARPAKPKRFPTVPCSPRICRCLISGRV